LVFLNVAEEILHVKSLVLSDYDQGVQFDYRRDWFLRRLLNIPLEREKDEGKE